MTKAYLSSNLKGIKNDPFFQELDFLFKNAFDSGMNFTPMTKDFKTPYPMDVWLNDEFYTIEIPIYKGSVENIKVTLDGDILQIKYERGEQKETANQYLTRSIVKRDFNFQWKVFPRLDKTKISSTYENGLLTVTIPFAEKQQPEEIKVIDISGNWKKIAEGEPL